MSADYGKLFASLISVLQVSVGMVCAIVISSVIFAKIRFGMKLRVLRAHLFEKVLTQISSVVSVVL